MQACNDSHPLPSPEEGKNEKSEEVMRIQKREKHKNSVSKAGSVPCREKMFSSSHSII